MVRRWGKGYGGCVPELSHPMEDLRILPSVGTLKVYQRLAKSSDMVFSLIRRFREIDFF